MKKRVITALILSIALMAGGCGRSGGDTGETAETETALHASESTVTLTEGKYSEEKLDASWDEKNAVEILCDGSIVTASDDGVTVKDSVITISEEGTYVLTGTLTDGQLVVDVENKGSVRMIFNGISLTSTSTAPVYVKEGNVIITLAEDTENTVTDGQEYLYGEGEDEPKAAIYAKDDLTFNGTGSLTVSANYSNGIQCKDDLKFVTGSYHITAVNNGIVGKDSVSVKNGNFTIEAGRDGIKSTNIEETDKGYILIESGAFTITAGADGIQAETLLRVNGGTFEIVTGGGSQSAAQRETLPGDKNPGGGKMPEGGDKPQFAENTDDSTEAESMKGLKSYVEVLIAGGSFVMDTCDDGVHSNQNVILEGGTLTVQTGDDGVHADKKLTINAGSVDIQKSYEGLEGFEIEINGGDIKAAASDDGINAAGGDDSAANPEDLVDTKPKTQENTLAERGSPGGAPGMGGGMADEDQGAVLTVNGGTVYVNADGDGLDANGDIYINGGEITVHGPVDGGNGTLDFASECKITGGTFVADGSMGMVQNPSGTSTQPVIIKSTSGTTGAGTAVSLTDEGGKVLLEYTTEKAVQWFAVSTAELQEGKNYTLQIGDEKTEVSISQTIMEIN